LPEIHDRTATTLSQGLPFHPKPPAEKRKKEKDVGNMVCTPSTEKSKMSKYSND